MIARGLVRPAATSFTSQPGATDGAAFFGVRVVEHDAVLEVCALTNARKGSRNRLEKRGILNVDTSHEPETLQYGRKVCISVMRCGLGGSESSWVKSREK